MVDHGFPVASAHNFGVASAHNFRGGVVELEEWVFPSSWALCKASDPNVNFLDELAYASTRTNNTFSDESRTIFKFNPSLAYDKFHRINFGRIGANPSSHPGLARGVSSTFSTYGARLDWTGQNSLPRERSLFIKVRITPVIDDFDTSLVTWNNIDFLGTTFDFEAYPYAAETLPPDSTGTTKDRDIRLVAISPFESHNFSFIPNTGTGIEGIKVVEPGSPPETTFFGFIIDIFLSHNGTNPAFTNVTQNAHLGITVETKDFAYTP